MNKKINPIDLAGDIGKKGIALAIAMTIILPLALSLLFYPVANMELKGLPFGVLSLDKGATTPTGDINIGDTLVEKIESGELADSIDESSGNSSSSTSETISFTKYDSQEALDEAIENGELYGAIIIPEDFTELQVKAMMASQASQATQAAQVSTAGAAQAPAESMANQDVEKPTLQIVINYAKSPLVATQMETGMASMFSMAEGQFDVEVSVVNEGAAANAESSNANPMAGMLSQMVVLMPILICSIIAGIFIVKGFGLNKRKLAAERIRFYVASLVANAIVAAVLSLMMFWVITCVAGIPADFSGFFGYCWIVSFFLMTFFGGLASLRGRLAAVVGLLILLLGMTSAYLPVEALPAFWQDWVVPWAPEYYMGNGLREVIFAGGSVWNAGTQCTGIYALVGVCVAFLSIAVQGKLAKVEKLGAKAE